MNWLRHYHGMAADPKFRLIARAAKLPTPFAIAAWCGILEHASERDDRGSLEGLTAELLAVTVDIAEEEAAALLEQFAKRRMIADGLVTKWEARQPSWDDATARKRNSRAKKKHADPGPNGTTGNGPVEPDDNIREFRPRECSNGTPRHVTFPDRSRDKPAHGHVTTPECHVTYPRARATQNRTDKIREDSIAPPGESYDPRASRSDGPGGPEAGAKISASPGGSVSRETIDALMPVYELRNSRYGVERLVELLVLQAGSVAKVEGRLIEAVGRAVRDPIAYVRRILDQREVDKFAAGEAAKHQAQLDPIEEGYRMFNATCAHMEKTNAGENFTYENFRAASQAL